MMSDEVHDYSEIYTPSTEVKGVIAEDSAGPTTTASTTSMSSHSEFQILQKCCTFLQIFANYLAKNVFNDKFNIYFLIFRWT